jgi:uncharacterized repeat protein (TIGR03803 family)
MSSFARPLAFIFAGSMLVIAAVCPILAATYTEIYAFKGHADGAAPAADLTISNGVLYGTTTYGGSRRCSGGCGTVFSVTPAGAENVVYTFLGGTKSGSHPQSDVVVANGELFGTTSQGGKSDMGTFYSLTPAGAEQVLYAFKGRKDGYDPESDLLDVNGTFYGTTAGFSPNGQGSVFSFTLLGTRALLHSFKGGNDGSQPFAGLTNINGTFYGETTYGGSASGPCFGGCGTIFSLSPSGIKKTLHAFVGGADGSYPNGGLIAVGGTLYGTTNGGGTGGCIGGCGTVFAISPSGHETVLYSFQGFSDGVSPYAGLATLNGLLYGTTYQGGASGAGTVFAVNPLNGVETVIYSFGGGDDGANPYASLTVANGVLYGTTQQGGSSDCQGSGCGTVFSITP